MSNQRRSNYSLNSDQRLLLETYITLFNHTNRQMDSLREIQRGIIQDIRVLTNLQNTHNNQNNSNENINNQNNNYSRNRGYTSPPRTNARRNYYGPSTGGEPLYFDFFSNPLSNRTNYANTLWNNFDELHTNVIVRPTADEIQRATRSVTFSQIINPLNVNCPISLEPFEDNTEVSQIIGCGHIFHTERLNTWFERNVRCPVCRYDIRTRNVQENNETSSDEAVPPSPETNPQIVDISNNEVVDGLTNLTENILSRLLNVGTNGVRFQRETTQVTYDPSSNEIIFRGFY